MRPDELAPRLGDVVLLKGPNGAGKTSFLRALAGLENPLFRPVAPAGSVALAPQDARDALVGLTVRGEFRLRARSLDGFVAPELADRPSAELSSGESRRVALACAEGAALVLLDEPSEGLDTPSRAVLRERIARAARTGAVVVADHGGAFDDLATRVVELAPAATHAPLPAFPRAEGPVLLEAPASAVRGCALPAVRLGPGFHALVGPNGAGKSTLLLQLAGLLPAEGVRVAGAPPRPGANVRLLLPHARDALTRERVADECAPHALVPEALRERHPLSLSGGEAQRVALAKTLGREAPVYLLDEPEAHLDGAARALLVESVAERVRRGAVVLAATHDASLASLAQSVIEVPG